MSSLTQLISVLVFMAYSIAYLFFVGWASDRTSGPKVRLGSRAGILMLSFGIGLPIAGLCILMRV